MCLFCLYVCGTLRDILEVRCAFPPRECESCGVSQKGTWRNSGNIPVFRMLRPLFASHMCVLCVVCRVLCVVYYNACRILNARERKTKGAQHLCCSPSSQTLNPHSFICLSLSLSVSLSSFFSLCRSLSALRSDIISIIKH